MAPIEPDTQQQEVLDHLKGPVLVTGGPGTGKTWALRERFARLIEGGADPERLVLVVRSKAARYATRRALFDRLGRSLSSLNVFTVHALANHVVGRRLIQLDYQNAPTVMTAAEQFAQIRELLSEPKYDWSAYGTMIELRGFADEVRNFILRAQEAMLEPDDIRARAEARGLSGWMSLADLFAEYLAVIDAQGKTDYAGLVAQAALVAGDGEPLFDHLLVDDYQEATRSSEELALRLNAASLVVAGDPGSHVFSFQGTTDVPIRGFVERVAARHIELSQRHRGGDASQEAWLASHPSEENALIARELRRIHVEESVDWGDLAIVTRRVDTRFSAVLRALDDAGVPRTTTEAWTSLASEPAVRPFVLALRWLADGSRRDALVEPLLGSELAGLSPAAARGLVRAARSKGMPPAAALEETEGLTEEEALALVRLRSLLQEAEAPASRSVQDTFAHIWRASEHSARLVAAAESDAAAQHALDAVLAFSRIITKASETGDISAAVFLDEIDADEEGPGFPLDGETGGEGVRVLTAHGSAGMEFDTVFVAGAVEGDFPSLTRPEKLFDLTYLERSITQSERNRLRLEDERRLFDLVVGRARRRVVFTTSDDHADDATMTTRSRFVSAGWIRRDVEDAPEPVSVAEAAALWRRKLADGALPPTERLACLQGLLELGVDPARWWFQRDWSGNGEPLETGALHTSYSQLDSLQECALRFVLDNKLGLETSNSHSSYYAWVGKLVHSLIEECENGHIARSVEALAAQADERWDRSQFPSLAVSEEHRKLVREVMLPNWYAHYGQKPAASAESWFEFEFDGAVIRGAIDRIAEMTSGGYAITDYKSGKPEYLRNPEESLQLGIYWLAVNEAENFAAFRPVRKVELAYLKGDYKGTFKSAPYQPAGSKRDSFLEETKERVSDLLAELRARFESGIFRPNPAANCMFCEFKPLCSVHPEGAPVFTSKEVS